MVISHISWGFRESYNIVKILAQNLCSNRAIENSRMLLDRNPDKKYEIGPSPEIVLPRFNSSIGRFNNTIPHIAIARIPSPVISRY